MAIEFVCPACQGALRVADSAAGQVVRCGSCMTTLRVPSPPTDADTGAPLPDEPDLRSAAEPVAPPSARPTRPPRDRDDVDEYGEPRPRRRRRPPPPSGRGVLFWVLMAFLLVGFLTVAACGGAFLLLKEKWRTHTSAAGGFAVELPADPRGDMAELAKVKHQPNVRIEGTLLLVRLEEYSIVYADFEPGGRVFLTDDRILDDAVKGLKVDEPGVQILSENPTRVSGFPAREVVFTHPGGGTYLCRMVIADTRLFIASAGGPRTPRAGNERIRRFLDSFEVTDPKLVARGKQNEIARRLAELGARRAKERGARQPD